MKQNTLINPKSASLLPTGKIVEIYNILADKPVKKFKDRATAMARTNELMAEKSADDAAWARTLNGELAEHAEYIAVEDVKAEGKTTKKAPAKDKGESTGRGKKSALAGMKLVKQQKENPRKEGTYGHASYAAYRSGDTYEKAVEKGARPQDIKWDIAKGFVVAE